MPVTRLPSRFVLATTPWPRTGGNRRNSARVAIAGPTRGRVAFDIGLPDPVADGRGWRGGGVAVSADGALIVVTEGRIARVALDGRILAVTSIPTPGPDPAADDEEAAADDDDDDPSPRRCVLAPPVALADGSAVVLAPPELLVFDANGALVGAEYVGGHADDSALAPNVTHGGALVLTYVTGQVTWFIDGQRRELGGFGYDVVPPALYDDDAMAIAGYAGPGFVCVGPDGARRWRTDLRNADLLPAIDADGFAAVGSVNDERSIIVAPDGAIVGRLEVAAVFAEATDGHWFARADASVSRIRRDGSRVWTAQCDPSPGLSWGAQAPVADGGDRVYLLTPDGLVGLHADTGAQLFQTQLGSAPRAALALVAPGLAAVLLERQLVLID